MELNAPAWTLVLALSAAAAAEAGAWEFTEVAEHAGLTYSHGYVDGPTTDARAIAGGIAVGDYDRDRWPDLYVARGDVGPNLLFRNRGDGTFEEVGEAAGVDFTGAIGCGPSFADIDGDGWLDLFVGSIEGASTRILRNNRSGGFEDVSREAGIASSTNSFSASFGDHDSDGDLDLFVTHWGSVVPVNHLWRNDGGRFSAADATAGIRVRSYRGQACTFTANFADINHDDSPDLLLAADFGRSQVFLSNGNGTFTETTSPVISDENGMGAAVGDYDNDGDIDWFVSSIWDPDLQPGDGWGASGNRLYQNLGDGTFRDATDESGVRHGHWGWASSFADFDNDGWLDLAHVNGWSDPRSVFQGTRSRLFMANRDGTFSEQALAQGFDDRGEGRGLTCFDYDRDGDLDVLVANNSGPPALYRNDGAHSNGYLAVRLEGDSPNTEAVGARVQLRAGGRTQTREIRAGSNFVSQDLAEAHFGLGGVDVIDEVRVEWPDGHSQSLGSIRPNQLLVIRETACGEPTACPPPAICRVAPNPFVTFTELSYRVSRSTAVEFRVFDVQGRLARAEGFAKKTAGEHTIVWHGDDQAGRQVSSGVYFYEVRTAEWRSSGKLTLAR